MKIYKIECEYEMPIAEGYSLTKELAEKAIDDEDWSFVDSTKEDMLEMEWVSIEEIEVKE